MPNDETKTVMIALRSLKLGKTNIKFRGSKIITLNEFWSPERNSNWNSSFFEVIKTLGLISDKCARATKFNYEIYEIE